MNVSHQALTARMGNEAGARDEFERLTSRLAELKANVRVRRIRPDPGDRGVDAFAGRIDEGEELAVWQAKFFTDKLGDSQKAQVRNSFAKVCAYAEAEGFHLVRWTLVIPIDLSTEETEWWDQWKAEREAEHGLEIELWDKDALEKLLSLDEAEAIRSAFFPPFATRGPTARDVEPLPADVTFDGMLFIAQLSEAGITEVDSAREQFFNAELLKREVEDKGLQTELGTLNTVRSEARSIWEVEYAAAYPGESTSANASGEGGRGLYGFVMRALREHHDAQGPGLLRLNLVHRFGTMHQIVEDGAAGWVAHFREVTSRHRGQSSGT